MKVATATSIRWLRPCLAYANEHSEGGIGEWKSDETRASAVAALVVLMRAGDHSPAPITQAPNHIHRTSRPPIASQLYRERYSQQQPRLPRMKATVMPADTNSQSASVPGARAAMMCALMDHRRTIDGILRVGGPPVLGGRLGATVVREEGGSALSLEAGVLGPWNLQRGNFATMKIMPLDAPITHLPRRRSNRRTEVVAFSRWNESWFYGAGKGDVIHDSNCRRR